MRVDQGERQRGIGMVVLIMRVTFAEKRECNTHYRTPASLEPPPLHIASGRLLAGSRSRTTLSRPLATTPLLWGLGLPITFDDTHARTPLTGELACLQPR